MNFIGFYCSYMYTNRKLQINHIIHIDKVYRENGSRAFFFISVNMAVNDISLDVSHRWNDG